MKSFRESLLCRITTLAAVSFAGTTMALAQEDISSDQLAFFETNIRPALVKYCYECHSQEERSSRGGLFLDTRLDLLQGGDSGPAVVPGNAEESILWDAVMWQHGYEMPPDDPMPDAVIADFKKWIDMGLPDPRVREVADFSSFISKEDIEKARSEHWAFQGPGRESGASIDKIIDAELQREGLRPNQRADAYTLLRRINFDLIGLPPTLAEIEAFQAAWSRNPDSAVEAKVDELLARPQFGERWGRHWMDVARFAESSGSRNVSYPNAWRYRDYVIDSFNADKPYNRFVQEQIAGDLLPAKTDEQWQENLIATGFLAIGLKDQGEKNPRQFESEMVDEQINTLTQGFLGLTVGCARCHDHKYDPIPTHDYYALAGILHSTDTFFGTRRVAQNHRTTPLLLLPIPDQVSALDQGRLRDRSQLEGQLAKLSEEMAGMRNRGAKGNPEMGKQRRSLRNDINRIKSQLNEVNPDGTPKSFAMGVQESDEMVDANILLGGELVRPAQAVPRGFLQVLGDLNFEVDGKESGRLQLAEAMTAPSNPLIHRVMVNRIWQHLMGRPIVSTPSNFGFSGMEPENQALLDYLAVSFVDQGWSVKRLIREIILSQAYQRSSEYSEKNYAVDPDNKRLWRANAKPLTAEALRDATLALSGEINLERPLGSAVAAAGEGKVGGAADPNATYRAVYLPVIRDSADEMLGVFDFANANVTTATRAQSIVPTQALYMMNSDFIAARSRAMAGLLTKDFRSDSDRIKNAFLLAYGRPATEQEMHVSSRFFREFESSGPTPATPTIATRAKGKAKGGKGRAKGGSSPASNLPADEELAAFCQTLMASARFRILN